MVVQTLLLQESGQVAFVPVGLFQLCSLVLKPDLDLIVIQSELLGQRPPSLLSQISVGVELVLQPVQLVGGESRPRSLVLTRELLSLLLDLPGPRSAGGSVRVPAGETECQTRPDIRYVKLPRAEDPGRYKFSIRAPHHARGTVSVFGYSRRSLQRRLRLHVLLRRQRTTGGSPRYRLRSRGVEDTLLPHLRGGRAGSRESGD